MPPSFAIARLSALSPHIFLYWEARTLQSGREDVLAGEDLVGW